MAMAGAVGCQPALAPADVGDPDAWMVAAAPVERDLPSVRAPSRRPASISSKEAPLVAAEIRDPHLIFRLAVRALHCDEVVEEVVSVRRPDDWTKEDRPPDVAFGIRPGQDQPQRTTRRVLRIQTPRGITLAQENDRATDARALHCVASGRRYDEEGGVRAGLARVGDEPAVRRHGRA